MIAFVALLFSFYIITAHTNVRLWSSEGGFTGFAELIPHDTKMMCSPVVSKLIANLYLGDDVQRRAEVVLRWMHSIDMLL